MSSIRGWCGCSVRPSTSHHLLALRSCQRYAVREGQTRLASECAAALEGHPALHAWDLGNENSDKEVLFSAFGVPTRSRSRGSERSWVEEARDGPELVSKSEAASYVHRALRALSEAGASGAMVWCHSDYEPELHDHIPFDRAPHETSFGVFRSDGTPKPAVEVVRSFASEGRSVAAIPLHSAESFIDLSHDDFYDPKRDLGRLYGRYCEKLRQAHCIKQ